MCSRTYFECVFILFVLCDPAVTATFHWTNGILAGVTASVEQGCGDGFEGHLLLYPRTDEVAARLPSHQLVDPVARNLAARFL